jgi:hypothetical protein
MDRFVSQNAGGASVRGLAGRLLADAAVNPELIQRCDSVTQTHEMQTVRIPRLTLRPNPTLDERPYLEDIVSLALDAAERAKVLSAQAQQASRRARRETLVVGCFGALGLLIGAIGFAARSSSDAKLAQVSNQVTLVQDQLREAQRQIAASATTATSPQRAQSTATTGSAGSSPPALRPPSIRYNAQPWPDSSPNSPSSRQVAATPNAPSTSQHIFSGFEREIHSVFR